MRKNTDSLCGVNPFCTTEDDPFIECCRAHDAAYSCLPCDESTKEIDGIFLECCLAVAKTDKPLQLRAKTYYFLARNYGRLRYLFGQFRTKSNARKRARQQENTQAG